MSVFFKFACILPLSSCLCLLVSNRTASGARFFFRCCTSARVFRGSMQISDSFNTIWTRRLQVGSQQSTYYIRLKSTKKTRYDQAEERLLMTVAGKCIARRGKRKKDEKIQLLHAPMCVLSRGYRKGSEVERGPFVSRGSPQRQKTKKIVSAVV